MHTVTTRSGEVLPLYDKQGRHLSQTSPQVWSDLSGQVFDHKRGIDVPILEPTSGRYVTKEYFPDASRTQQHFADECDINNIVKRAQLTGILPQGDRQPQYGDFTTVPDYHAAQNLIAQAHSEFAMLPADVREFFKNDPSLFLDALNDPDMKDKLIELKIFDPDEMKSINNGMQSGSDDAVVTPSGTPPAKSDKKASTPLKNVVESSD